MVGAPVRHGSAVELLERFCARENTPTTLLVAAHPDDEVVGAGARLAQLRDVLVAHVTDGSPRDLRDAQRCGFATREEYARARRSELSAALRLVGMERAVELGCVDQEASLNLVPLARRIAGLIQTHPPEVVVTHPYEGGHPDHDATAFAVHAACRLVDDAPAILEMSSYHNGRYGIVTGEFLPSDEPEVTLELSLDEQDLKRRMLACFPTQGETLRCFRTDWERFRVAPLYDFTRPPHAGMLFYEQFPWGMNGLRFRDLAEDALVELRLGGLL